MKYHNWSLALVGLTLTSLSYSVQAEVYFTEEKVVASLFPGVAFKGDSIELTPAQISVIEKKSGETVRDKKIRLYRASTGERIFIDRVIGKHDFITYAVAIDRGGKVKGIEIMEYRETYGAEVKKADWRQQFVGKDQAAPLKLNQDIKNISGATLSSSHLAAGVRRLLQTYEFFRG